jgi:type II secretory pathway predicted ATPase ExeA
MSLIAKPGMGKTTILFQLLSQLEGLARTVFLFQTLCSPKELLRSLLRDLGVSDDHGDVVRMQEQLNGVLAAEARQGRTVVVVIDEAQSLEDSALELVRMLSNFETSSYKMMQIILAGQPQLREKLASPQLLQLRQRMSVLARLQPLSVEESRLYIRHRLQVAGYDFKTPLFSGKAEALIAKYSEGIPRNINNISFNALSLGCVLKQKTIREEVIRETLEDLELEPGAANALGHEPAERKLVAVRKSQSSTKSWKSLWWRIRFAACVLVLLQLLCSPGDRHSREALRGHSFAVGATSRQAGTIEVSSAIRSDRSGSDDPTPVASVSPTRSAPEISADETSGRPEAASSTPTHER